MRVLVGTDSVGITILDPEAGIKIPLAKGVLLAETARSDEGFVKFAARFVSHDTCGVNGIRVGNATWPVTGAAASSSGRPVDKEAR